MTVRGQLCGRNSPSSFTWVPGANSVSRFSHKHLYTLSHLTGSHNQLPNDRVLFNARLIKSLISELRSNTDFHGASQLSDSSWKSYRNLRNLRVRTNTNLLQLILPFLLISDQNKSVLNSRFTPRVLSAKDIVHCIPKHFLHFYHQQNSPCPSCLSHHSYCIGILASLLASHIYVSVTIFFLFISGFKRVGKLVKTCSQMFTEVPFIVVVKQKHLDIYPPSNG